jgi:hypothetical protein
MSSFFQALGAAGIVTAAVALILVSMELKQIRLRLQNGVLRVALDDDEAQHCCHTGTDPRSGGGYAIFVFREGRWVVEADFSEPGNEPAAPRIQGRYESQAVTTQSVPKRDQ